MGSKIIKKIKLRLVATIIHLYKNRFLWSGIFTLGFAGFLLPISESVAFSVPGLKDGNFFYSYCLKFFFIAALYLVFIFFIQFFYKAFIKKQLFYQRWLLYSLIYLTICIVTLLLMYPGHWVWDEFTVLEQAKLYLPFSWQGNLTSILYTFSLYLFPSAITIVIVQLFIASLAVGYATSLFDAITNHRRYLPYIFMLFFLTAPIILNNIYPLRLTIYSYVELLLLARFIAVILKIHTPANKYVDLILAGVLIGILCSWRSEGMYYILFLPIYFYALGFLKKKYITDYRLLLMIVVTIVSIWLLIAFGKSNPHPLYPVTATINPISNMIQSELKGERVKESLDAIDKVIDINIVKKYPSHNEIPSFWQPNARREGYAEHIDEYNKAFIYLVTNNPYEFLKSRFYTFMSTNSFGAVRSLPSGVFGSPSPQDVEKVEKFNKENKLTQPINIEVKKHLTSLLLPPLNPHTLSISHLIWNIIPITIGLVGLFIVALLRRKVMLAIVVVFILTRVPLIFLTAPANYFMYYLPVYISGGALLWGVTLVLFLRIIKRARSKKALSDKASAHNPSLSDII